MFSCFRGGDIGRYLSLSAPSTAGLLPFIIWLGCVGAGAASYSTPNTGVSWTLDDLVDASSGAVTGSHPSYGLHDDVFVQASDTLTIPAGTTLVRDEGVVWPVLVVKGTLRAPGTESDPILVTSGAPRGSGGDFDRCIEFHESASTNCLLEWVTVEKADYGFAVFGSTNIDLYHCTARQCNRGAYTGGDLNMTDCTVIDNGSADRPLAGAGVSVTTSGSLQMTGCRVEGNISSIYGGGGVRLDSQRNRIEDCDFVSNRAAWGGGIYLYHTGAGNTVQNCRFTDNVAYNNGGGLCFEDGSDAVILGNVFEGNRASYGGAAYMTAETNAIVQFWINELTGNAATNSGGGAYIGGGTLGAVLIEQCAVVSNTAGWGGGLYCRNGTIVSNCQVTANVATNYGGGFNLGGEEGTPVEVYRCAISNNLSQKGGGAWAGSHVQLHGCRFIGNEATADGGGLLSAGTGTFNGNVFEKNRAAYGGGAEILFSTAATNRFCGNVLEGNTASASGGGAYVDGGTLGVAIVEGCTVTNNTARWGGGLFCRNSTTVSNCYVTVNAAEESGGGIYLRGEGSTTPEIADAQLSGNRAGWGGGVRIFSGAVMCNVEVGNNTAAKSGGGAYIGEGALLDAVCFASNSASWGGGVYLDSGGELVGGEVRDNVSTRLGGGVYFRHGGSAVGTHIHDNVTAEKGGGVYFLSDGSLDRCRLTRNRVTLSRGQGGGAYCDGGGTIRNTAAFANSASRSGGGIFCEDGRVSNCTVVRNEAGFAGGIHCYDRGVVENSIVFENQGESHSGNWYYRGAFGGFRYSCLEPLAEGEGNFTNAPGFLSLHAGDLRLSSLSPCVDAGDQNPWMGSATDLDGNPRIMGDGVDIGACESGPLVCNFDAMPEDGLSPLTVTLRARVGGTNTPGYTCSWRFGGGDWQTATNGSTVYTNTFVEEGFHDVELSVQTSQGLTVGSLRRGCVRVRPSVVYVASTGGHVPPFSSWATAATDVQTAVDAAASGASVLITNGIYHLVSPVHVASGVRLRSVSGPRVTILDGQRRTRCLEIAHSNAVVSGFALVHGCANYGGGAHMTAGTLSRCLIRSNLAYDGGGVFFEGGGAIENCVVRENIASHYGGGTMGDDGGMVRNCTVTANTARSGGGVQGGAVVNSIVYDNMTSIGSSINNQGSACSYSCISPKPAGVGNISGPPRFVSSSSPLLFSSSPCIDAGSATSAAGTEDFDGAPRIVDASVDMGCAEHVLADLTGPLDLHVGDSRYPGLVEQPVRMEAAIGGKPIGCEWRMGDGMVFTDTHVVEHAYSSTGSYGVVVTTWNHEARVSTTAMVTVVAGDVTAYVSPAGLHVWPFDSWVSAATNIQAAVDAVPVGGVVLAAPGTYTHGSYVKDGIRHRVGLDKAVRLQAVGGDPQDTVIVGSGPPGPEALRGVYISDGAELVGFTVSNGCTRTERTIEWFCNGGGVWCEDGGTLVRCRVVACEAASQGGGMYGGLARDCVFTRNVSALRGGGVAEAEVQTSLLEDNLSSQDVSSGGGAYKSQLTRCVLAGNRADSGGGAADSDLDCCLVSGNVAASGGGVWDGTLRNCTVVGNIALEGEGGGVGGIGGGFAYNSIIYHNIAARPTYEPYSTDNYFRISDRFFHCCTFPPVKGAGSTSEDPRLLSFDSGLLSADSPCIEHGSNADVPAGVDQDLDGDPRIEGVVDIGCDEFVANTCTGFLSVAIVASCSTVAVDTAVQLDAAIQGRSLGTRWDLGDGETVDDAPRVQHAYAEPGSYRIVLTGWNHSGAVATTVTVSVVTAPLTYVSLGGSHVPPFTSWQTASTTIQDAIDAAPAIPGAEVRVAEGVYDRGSYPVHGTEHRIGVWKPLVVRAVNPAPWATVIKGQEKSDQTRMRGAYLGDGAHLIGFTVTEGYAAYEGGGVWCEGRGVVDGCTIVGNYAWYGGGTLGGTIRNSTIVSNSSGCAYGTLDRCRVLFNRDTGARSCVVRNSFIYGQVATDVGGGARQSIVENCTVMGNEADRGAGVYQCTARNSIVFGNTSRNVAWRSADNWMLGNCNHCCTTPLPEGPGNITNDPAVVGFLNPHLLAVSRCIDAGSNGWVVTECDLDWDSRILEGRVDIGCDEFSEVTATGALQVAIQADGTNVLVGFPVELRANITGKPLAFAWDWGDGSLTTNTAVGSHAYNVAGQYRVTLSAWHAATSAVAELVLDVLSSGTNYVSPLGAHVPPFLSWATASTNIQDAVLAAPPGATILVADGVYETGQTTFRGVHHRLVINKPVSVVAASGNPSGAVIRGHLPPGDQAVRCAYVGSRARLCGFTLTEGGTRTSGALFAELSGGGVWCERGGTVSNCIVCSNVAWYAGGGLYGGVAEATAFFDNQANLDGGGAANGVLYSCVISNNSAHTGGGGLRGAEAVDSTIRRNWSGNRGGGASEGLLTRCKLIRNSSGNSGGGSFRCTVTRSVYEGNTALSNGGGADYGLLRNCVIRDNLAIGYSGGGTHYSDLENCTVYDNLAPAAGGMAYGTARNSIVWGNHDSSGSPNFKGTEFVSSCTDPPQGVSAVTGDPVFRDAANTDFRLDALSPCIDAGLNEHWMFQETDFSGLPRILHGTVDIGAYETPFYLRARALLRGPYDADVNAMTTTLSAKELIPSASPYASARATLAVPSNVTDWVLLELRDTNGIKVVALSCFLKPDGAIVSADGSSDVLTEVSPGAALHLVVKHRNHLAVMSDEPLVFTNTVTLYDFTVERVPGAASASGCDSLAPGVWGLPAGDANADGRVTDTDRRIVDEQAGMRGYLQGDLNLDGVVSKQD